MKLNLKILLGLMVSITLVFSCKKVDIAFGQQFIDNGFTQIVKVDSFGVDLSTVFVDSFATAATGTTLLGGYTDPIFGRIDTKSYFEIAPPAYSDIYASTTLDSVSLILKPNKYYYGDSTTPIYIKADELDSLITLRDNTVSFFNTQSFPVKIAPALGEKTFYHRPNQFESIEIKLRDDFGQKLLNKLKDNTDKDIKSNAEFLQYFKGIQLSSNSSTQMIVGCVDTIHIRLYYTKHDLFNEARSVDFSSTNKGHFFNNITTTDKKFPLDQLNAKNNEISSTLMGNRAFTQFVSGSMLKIKFPSVPQLLKQTNFAKILKAQLIVKPVKGTYNSTFPLPPNVRLATTSTLNQIGNDLSFITTSGAPATQMGSLALDNYLGENTNYSYDLTDYLKAAITDPSFDKKGLLMMPPLNVLQTQFNRLIIGDGNNSNGKIQLVIYYVAVK